MTTAPLAVPGPLQAAIDGFAGRHPETADSETIRDQCVRYSYAFADELEMRGDCGDCVVVNGLEVTYADGVLVITGGHFAVLVCGLVVDWTYRQFDPACPVPRLSTLAEWRQEWAEAGAVITTVAGGGVS